MTVIICHHLSADPRTYAYDPALALTDGRAYDPYMAYGVSQLVDCPQ